MKLVIIGGHFSPALSIIENLPKDWTVHVYGRKYVFDNDPTLSYEYMICQKFGIPFKNITSGRIKRFISPSIIFSPLKTIIGFFQALHALQQFKPDAILSFGGYISTPVSVAGYILKIPIFVHEQTQTGGIANRFVACLATKVFLSFPSSKKYFPKSKTQVVGLPLRSSIFKVEQSISVPTSLPIIYVCGGSTGSHFINQTLKAMLPELLKKYIVIHQTGDSREFLDYDDLTKLRVGFPPEVSKRYIIRKFIFPDEIGWVFKNATLIISRGGMNTVAELIALKKMALLFPIFHGQKGEQSKNAELFKSLGLGDYIGSQDVKPYEVLQKINFMIENPQLYKVKDRMIRGFDFNNASKLIIDSIQSINEEKDKKN